jgi:hypothetical protein
MLPINNKLILVLNSPVSCGKKIDVVIITGNPQGSVAELIRGIPPAIIVFDCSNARSKIARWTDECLAAGINSFSVPDEGAFVMTLN